MKERKHDILEPALLYKEKLTKLFETYLYTDESFWYTGYGHANVIPEIRAEDNVYQYAIMGKGRVYKDGKEHRTVLGYIAYKIDPATNTADQFGLFSFDPGNLTVGEAVFKVMERLLKTCRRIEWRMIGGNPVEKAYDRFCKKHNGNKVVLHEVTKDQRGKYHDVIIYEVLCDKAKKEV
jgi:hypothetical protein